MGLDIVEFILATEQEFDLFLPYNELGNVVTVGDLRDLVHQKLLAKHGLKHHFSNEDIFIRLKKLLVVEQGLSEQDIYRTSRFVQDLRMD